MQPSLFMLTSVAYVFKTHVTTKAKKSELWLHHLHLLCRRQLRVSIVIKVVSMFQETCTTLIDYNRMDFKKTQQFSGDRGTHGPIVWEGRLNLKCSKGEG